MVPAMYRSRSESSRGTNRSNPNAPTKAAVRSTWTSAMAARSTSFHTLIEAGIASCANGASAPACPCERFVLRGELVGRRSLTLLKFEWVKLGSTLDGPTRTPVRKEPAIRCDNYRAPEAREGEKPAFMRSAACQREVGLRPARSFCGP